MRRWRRERGSTCAQRSAPGSLFGEARGPPVGFPAVRSPYRPTPIIAGDYDRTPVQPAVARVQLDDSAATSPRIYNHPAAHCWTDYGTASDGLLESGA